MARSKKKTAAEIYEVQPQYERFNQRHNITRQLKWNAPIVELEKRWLEKRQALVEQGAPGYGRIDKAFLQGASANLANTGFSANYPNQPGNSWRTVQRETVGLAASRKIQDVPGPVGLSPKEATSAVRKIASLSGAEDVGFALLDRRWVYSHYYDEKTKRDYPIRFSDEPGLGSHSRPVQLEDGTQVIPAAMKYVVVLIHEMDEAGMSTAPTLTQMATTMLAYSRISFSVVSIAEFIRGLGYNAIPSSNCTALSIPLAVDAGLGQLGRNAKLITPRFGPRCRISKVITDMPLETGHPVDLGVTEFCNSCLKCARKCPAGAIPLGPRSVEPVNECNARGVRLWQVDHHKCFEYWAKIGTNCGICIRVCPFNKGKHWVHGITREVIKRAKPADRAIARLDDLMGFGRFGRPERFWD